MDWLMFRRLFSLVLSVAQKDIERAEEKKKKRRRRREEDFDLSLSLFFLSFSLPRKNRLIVSFYKFPRLSFFFFFSLAREVS
jgi:hypothetical protein